jgi:sialidase-1
MSSGRLIVPVWISTGEDTSFGPGKLGHRPACVVTIYSDDHGATWQRGEIVAFPTPEAVSLSESMAVQLEDGRVMLIIRNRSTRYRRLVAYSPDGISRWTPPQYHDDLYEPICMASIIRLTTAQAGGRSRLLFSNPDSRHNPATRNGLMRFRENLTVRMSYDEGVSWPVAKVIDPGFAGYSDLAVGPDGTIFCLYEGGDRDGNFFKNTHMSIARLSLDWLTDGHDSLD